jgi:hypothetical protein
MVYKVINVIIRRYIINIHFISNDIYNFLNEYIVIENCKSRWILNS